MANSHQRRHAGAAPARPALDKRLYDAACDLHACVLALDAERQRLSRCLNVLPRRDVVLLPRADLERRHAELTDELTALRGTIQRLRANVDPESKYL